MRTGELRHRIEIQTRLETQNEYGEIVPVWETVAIRWGRIEPLMGRERFLAQAVTAATSHKITLRYIALNPKQRLVYQGRVFNIQSVLTKDENKHETQILAEEVF